MLTIRKEQMDELDRQARVAFEKQMLALMRSTHPEQTRDMSDGELKELISTGIDKALGYDITLQADIRRFLDYKILFGPDFDQDPEREWMGDILLDESLTGSDKIAWIDDDLTRAEEG